MGSPHNTATNQALATDVNLFNQWWKSPNGYLFGTGLYVSATVVTDMAGNTVKGWSPGAIFIDVTNAISYTNKGATIGTENWTANS